eukprot:CAMPEP_0180283094 /NCGR_PEP_ID=MMETSP0988-20121125/10246_1 /TAXON_ID=697907 /ORGANISM="non described non described, Strain CCMP2293" /LENGTH=334 /DNA_ID=CAMNT_0022255511 /DNA_START=155 /DNA_END=1159 /DNA_ORIENTATION=+
MSKQLSHMNMQRDLAPAPAVRKMPSSGGGEFVELAASLHVEYEPATRRALVPFHMDPHVDKHVRRAFSTLANNIVASSPANINRLLSAGEDKFVGSVGTRLLKGYGQRVKRSWVGKAVRALIWEDSSSGKIVEVPVESAALEELLSRAAEEDRCAKEVMANDCPFSPKKVATVSEEEPFGFEEAEEPRGPRRSNSEELMDASTLLAVEDPVCAAETLAESDRLLTEASSVCTPTPSRPARRGRPSLLIQDAARGGATGELRELVWLYSRGSPQETKGALALHVEEGLFVVRVTGEVLPRNHACVDLAGLAAHAERHMERQVAARGIDGRHQLFQ